MLKNIYTSGTKTLSQRMGGLLGTYLAGPQTKINQMHRSFKGTKYSEKPQDNFSYFPTGEDLLGITGNPEAF